MKSVRGARLAWLSFLAVAPLQAQRGADRFSCRDDDHGDRWGARFCTVEEQRIRPGGTIRVNAGPNGGVSVVGWDRNEIEVRSKITARGRTDERAEDLGRAVRLVIEGTEISADGPRTRDREWWSVSFELRVPRNSDLWIRSTNGGIDIAEVQGEMDLSTTNGGLSLSGLAGDIRAETTNGGVDVELVGRRWQGAGLDVRTTNGGIDLRIPDRYSADLETGTTNGGIDFDFPIQVRGRLTKRITTTLGDGGPPIRVVTTNGGVSVRRG
jgi:hypothetical protein